MSEIKAGDTVRLKSGGPLMTVERVGTYGATVKERLATCTWFNDTNRLQEKFAVASLDIKDDRQ